MKIKVLLVEDEKKIREGIKIILEEVIHGYKVLWEADNGERALDILGIEVPELVITDIRMPKMNGIDFIGLLSEKHPNIPVIVISGYDDYAYVREALKLGVKDYLLKPISPQELASILNNIFNSKFNTHKTGEKDSELIIDEIKLLIDNNLERKLSLNFISNILGLHPNYISNLFSNHTKSKLSDYIAEKRILKAGDLLQNTNLKIYDIANLTGYSNAKYFSSVFKKYMKQTPHEYRKMNK